MTAAHLDCPDEPAAVAETRATPPDDLEALRALRLEAAQLGEAAVAAADLQEAAEREAMGQRLVEEQDRLYGLVLGNLPSAVREAAAAGQRSAVVLRFGGADKLGEFCYLYMLKGPHSPDGKAEMKALGAAPLLHRLRAALNPAGFRVWHAWQRATNDNTLAVSW